MIHHLRGLVVDPDTAALPDAALLERFLTHRDEAAFEALVRRHGPLVLGVCRRRFPNAEDAEDAFQATFLVLARRAGDLRHPGLLGNWLYGVAHRTALKARAAAARRRALERQVRTVSEPDPADALMREDLRRVLDGELSRLPSRYRVPIVLCYLEGLTQEEAAQRLGYPRKTVTTRLARACRLLERRLTQRGAALSAGALTMAPPSTRAAPPGALLGPTIKAATAFAAGNAAAGGTTPQAARLAEGVLRAMRMTKWTVALALVVGLALAGAGAGAFAYRQGAQEPPKKREAPGAKKEAGPAAGPDKEDALKKALVDAARKTYEINWARLRRGQTVTVDEIYRWSRRWLEAELEMGGAKERKEGALKGHLDRMKELAKFAHMLATTGQGRRSDASGADFFRIQAELWLARGQAK